MSNSHRVKFALTCGIVFGALLNIVDARAATIVTYSFTGNVTSIRYAQGLLFPSISIGSAFSGTVSFDTDTLNINPNPAVDIYSPAGVLFAIDFGSNVYESLPTARPNADSIAQEDDPLTETFDSWGAYKLNSTNVGFSDPGALFNGQMISRLSVSVYLAGAGNGGSILPLLFSSYTSGNLSFSAGDDTTLSFIDRLNADLTSFQRVENTIVTPLPAALPLLAAGLSAMGFMGWRKRKA